MVFICNGVCSLCCKVVILFWIILFFFELDFWLVIFLLLEYLVNWGFDVFKEVILFLIGVFIKLLILLVIFWKLSVLIFVCFGKVVLLFWIIVEVFDLSIVLLRFFELVIFWFLFWFFEGKFILLLCGFLLLKVWVDKLVVFVVFFILRFVFGLIIDFLNGLKILIFDDVGSMWKFWRSDIFGFNGEMFSVCMFKVGLNLVGLFSLKGSVDVKGFDRIGICILLLFLLFDFGLVCDVVGEGWSVVGYFVFICFVFGIIKNWLGLFILCIMCMK